MPAASQAEKRVPQFCIVLRGPAGAGKSTLARAVQQGLSQKVAAIDTDIFNWQIVPGEDDKELVYENIRVLAEKYLEHGSSVIVEGLIITSEERGTIAELRQLALSRGVVFIDFYCQVPKALAVQRNGERFKGVSQQMIEQWWELAEADKENVRWPLVKLDMALDPRRSATQLLRHLGIQNAAEQGGNA